MLPDRFLSCSPHDTVPPLLSYSLSGVGGMNLGIKNPRQLIRGERLGICSTLFVHNIGHNIGYSIVHSIWKEFLVLAC